MLDHFGLMKDGTDISRMCSNILDHSSDDVAPNYLSGHFSYSHLFPQVRIGLVLALRSHRAGRPALPLNLPHAFSSGAPPFPKEGVCTVCLLIVCSMMSNIV